MNSQRSDGSWNSFPALRVTNNEIENPWESANPGTLHKDQNRLFTTVSVLYSLSLI